MAAKTSRPISRPAKPRQSARAKSSNAAGKNMRTLADRGESVGKSVLIHGFSDSGKTVLAIQHAPRPILVLDCDNGLDSVMGMVGSDEVYLWEPSDSVEYSFEDLDEYRNYILAGDWAADFRCVITDNLTAAQKPFIRHALDESMARLPDEKKAVKDPDIPSQQDWGKIYRTMDRWIQDIRNGTKRRGVHAIFTAGTKEWKDEDTGTEKIFPNLEGQTRGQVSSHMDAVGYLEIDDGERLLHLAPTGAIITRVRLPVDRHGRMPEEIKDPDFTKMMAAIKGQEGEVKKTKAKTPEKRKPTTKPTKKK